MLGREKREVNKKSWVTAHDGVILTPRSDNIKLQTIFSILSLPPVGRQLNSLSFNNYRQIKDKGGGLGAPVSGRKKGKRRNPSGVRVERRKQED